MGGANGLRREHRPLRIEPEVGQVTEYGAEGPSVIDGKKPSHVLQEDVARSHVTKDADNLRPEPSFVLDAAAGAGCAGRLARETRTDEIHRSRKGGSGEVPDIAKPDRRRIHGLRFARASQNRGAKRLPLDHADDASMEAQVGKSGEDAAFESADAGEESEDVERGKIHIHRAPSPAPTSSGGVGTRFQNWHGSPRDPFSPSNIQCPGSSGSGQMAATTRRSFGQ